MLIALTVKILPWNWNIINVRLMKYLIRNKVFIRIWTGVDNRSMVGSHYKKPFINKLIKDKLRISIWLKVRHLLSIGTPWSFIREKLYHRLSSLSNFLSLHLGLKIVQKILMFKIETNTDKYSRDIQIIFNNTVILILRML